MAKKRETIYQKLGSTLNFNGFGFDDPKETNKRKIIIRGDSPEDVKRKTLELQQKKALEEKFFKVTDHGFQKAMQYEAARLPAYLDYEGMEYYPLIASALDLLMEESTTIGENGRMLNIYSNNDRIRENLEELFYDIINVNTNLPFWIRQLCKYGDNFVYLVGQKNKGVTFVKQLVNYEMERIERVEYGKPMVKFKQRETGDEFNIFEIAHFRILGDDKYLPYGSSMLNKIRRVFRQLIMAEDAMLTYRIIRAGEKRVFKIDVGNIDEDDIESYIHKIATRFKKQQLVYPNSGQIDYTFNILGNDEDFFLPVRNANVQTGIDTLPGAQNLDQIQDIEYLRDNLFTGLGIPKPFLGFQEAAGEGKNMAQMDVRFAKKINRIQQAAIQELNKIAIIHLLLLGFDKKEIYDFQLSLTNPSTQQDILKAELWQQKSQVYSELTRNEGGIAAMSHTRAKKFVFGWSDKDIVQDYLNQRMERAVAQELQDSPLIIKKTGLFSDIDKKYGIGDVPPEEMPQGGGEEGGMGGGLEGEGAPEDLGSMGGGEFQTPADLPPVESKQKRKGDKLLSEREYKEFIEKLVNNNSINEKIKIDDSEPKIINEELNEKSSEMLNKTQNLVNEIDSMLEDKDTLNTDKNRSIRTYSDKNDETGEFNIDDLDVD
jgi:hypothetical protein